MPEEKCPAYFSPNGYAVTNRYLCTHCGTSHSMLVRVHLEQQIDKGVPDNAPLNYVLKSLVSMVVRSVGR